MSINLVNPLFLAANRVRRPYKGGLMLDRFTGRPGPADGPFPEDWLLSASCAEKDADSGVTRLTAGSDGPELRLTDLLDSHAEALLGRKHVEAFGPRLGFCAKWIDPAEALPVQYCPVPPEELVGGVVWHLVGRRDIGGQEPHVLVGLKSTADAEAFRLAAPKGDRAALESMMHRVPLHLGETYHIPAGVPFALGAGAMALQMQLPGEEARVGPKPLEDDLASFDPDSAKDDDLPRRIVLGEHILHRSDEGYYAELVGADRFSGGSLWRIEVITRMYIKLPRSFALVLCPSGEGRLTWPSGTLEISSGESFFLPFGVPWVEYAAFGRLSLLVVLPPAT